MINDITNDAEDGMKKAVEAFKRELVKIRTGRANTSMLDGIRVDYYGTPTPVNQVATVAVVDARLITVKPWEKSMIPVIDKAIRASDLGINPVALTPSGTGGQVSVLGVAGIAAGWEEGVEINLLGLTFGLDPLSLSIKLPLLGRIGPSESQPVLID